MVINIKDKSKIGNLRVKVLIRNPTEIIIKVNGKMGYLTDMESFS